MCAARMQDVGDSFFFFQAEDGIRDLTVTGVQTCALPIWTFIFRPELQIRPKFWISVKVSDWCFGVSVSDIPLGGFGHMYSPLHSYYNAFRSEERRVGKECRSRWSPYH